MWFRQTEAMLPVTRQAIMRTLSMNKHPVPFGHSGWRVSSSSHCCLMLGLGADGAGVATSI